MYRRRARRESMMLLLKVLVTSIEGVDDSPSYAVATSKEGVNDAASGDKHGSMEGVDDGTSYAVQDEQEVEAGMGVIDDDTAKGTGVKELTMSHIPPGAVRARIAKTSVSDNNQDVEEVDDGEVVISLGSRTSFFPLTSLLAQCEKRQQGRARGCVEGFDDGATATSSFFLALTLLHTTIRRC
ncbi:uncharacterized protein G2W53_037994 [Senna tora]|uniref:Uncharacterized protein n=1 Tax=Senna tora TaxID=362788 RepID=A0A834W1P0_9FABA|nr:uncharacterized protein G2W53_037994 [Senna tora]